MADKHPMIPLGIYICADCGRTFDAPGLIEDSTNAFYGDFLFYAKNGTVTLFNAFDEPTKAIVRNFKALMEQHKDDHPKLGGLFLTVILATALDPAPDDSAYNFNPYCPYCGSPDTQVSTPRRNGLDFVPSGVQPIAPSFERWLSLSTAEQAQQMIDYTRWLSNKFPLMKRKFFPFDSSANSRVTIDNDGVIIGNSSISTDQILLDNEIATISTAELRQVVQQREKLTKNTCQPQLAAYLFTLTHKAHLMNRYFPITNAFDAPTEADFQHLIVSIVQRPTFDIHLIAEKRKDRTAELPTDTRNLVAGHIAEIFFYRLDLLDQFLSKRRGFFLYTTPQAYKDDGGVAGGCYNPQRDAIQLVMSRLYEGFNAPTPGVAPFIHEFGHMLDHASGNRGMIPGMDEFLDLFRRGKQLELVRSEALRSGRGDTFPIGHPYVFQNDGEFIAGYLEMFFRNPHYFAAQNPDLYQAFAQCLKQDPRQYWKADFPFYIQQNRDYYARQRPPKPGLTLP